jgi:hypothetical protein
MARYLLACVTVTLTLLVSASSADAEWRVRYFDRQKNAIDESGGFDTKEQAAAWADFLSSIPDLDSNPVRPMCQIVRIYSTDGAGPTLPAFSELQDTIIGSALKNAGDQISDDLDRLSKEPFKVAGLSDIYDGLRDTYDRYKDTKEKILNALEPASNEALATVNRQLQDFNKSLDDSQRGPNGGLFSSFPKPAFVTPGEIKAAQTWKEAHETQGKLERESVDLNGSQDQLAQERERLVREAVEIRSLSDNVVSLRRRAEADGGPYVVEYILFDPPASKRTFDSLGDARQFESQLKGQGKSPTVRDKSGADVNSPGYTPPQPDPMVQKELVDAERMLADKRAQRQADVEKYKSDRINHENRVQHYEKERAHHKTIGERLAEFGRHRVQIRGQNREGVGVRNVLP